LPMFPGKDILRFIRMDSRYARTRVILATSDSAAVRGEIEEKSDIVLLTPISFTQLRDLASRFLSGAPVQCGPPDVEVWRAFYLQSASMFDILLRETRE